MIMTIDDVLILDCETTGLTDRNARWDVDFMDFPHVVQIAWMNQFKQESHIIYPDGWEIPEDVTAVGRCLPVIIGKGLIELKVKEYEPEQGKIEFGKPETARIAPQSHETPVPVQTNVEAEKGPQIENPAKITGIENELLNQDNF